MEYKYIANHTVEKIMQKIKDFYRIFTDQEKNPAIDRADLTAATQFVSFDINTGYGYDIAMADEIVDVVKNACDTCNTISPLTGTLVFRSLAPTERRNEDSELSRFYNDDAYVTVELAFIRTISINAFINTIKHYLRVLESGKSNVSSTVRFTFTIPKTTACNVSIENLKKAVSAVESEGLLTNIREIVCHIEAAEFGRNPLCGKGSTCINSIFGSSMVNVVITIMTRNSTYTLYSTVASE